MEKLQVELDALLGDVEAPKWRPLLDRGRTAVDVLEEPELRRRS